MSKREYGQHCGLARALDLVGERWTLLIVRDLAVAPRRFGELLEGLPGLGTSLLSERLRSLEADGIVGRAAATRPGGGVVYELTESGERLAKAMMPLAFWGASYIDAEEPGEFRPDWLRFAIRTRFRADRAKGVHDCYEFRLGVATVWVTVDDGTFELHETKPKGRKPNFVATTDLATLADIGAGRLTAAEAMAERGSKFSGEGGAGVRAMEILLGS